MKKKLDNKEVLQRSKEFLTTVLEGTVAHTENVKNSIDHHKHMLEMELLHLQLMGRIVDVVGALVDICDNLEEKEQNLTIH
jgi:hypothetical protein